MIPSSKLHLMAHSVPMRKMLEESEIAEKGTITLVDIEPDTFKNFIKWVSFKICFYYVKDKLASEKDLKLSGWIYSLLCFETKILNLMLKAL